MSVAVVVRWEGSYSFDEAGKLRGSGLYLVWGRNRRGPDPKARKFLYCGISEDQRGVGARVRQHGGKPFDHYTNEWWIGRVRTPHDDHRQALEAAEWLVTAFSEETPKFAEMKTSAPRYTCSVINEWFTRGGDEVARASGVVKRVPDVLSWDADRQRLLWADRLKLYR